MDPRRSASTISYWAWLGGFLAMASFAFLPQIAGVINHGLTAVGLRPVGELLILAVVIACYKKMWDGCARWNPCFSNASRRTSEADSGLMRGMLFNLAVLMFYQILWPLYDRDVDMFSWLGHAGVLSMTGEQLIYVMASGLFLLTGIFVVFCVEETRLPQAPNKSFRELFLGVRKPAVARVLPSLVTGLQLSRITKAKHSAMRRPMLLALWVRGHGSGKSPSLRSCSRWLKTSSSRPRIFPTTSC